MITVRRAKTKDIPTIMQFLDDNWLHGYRLAHDREFFEWHYVQDGKVNIWIGIDDETGKLYATETVIFYRKSQHPDISESLWIAIKSSNPLLALEVQEALRSDVKPRGSFSPGLHPDAVKAHKLMGTPVVAMDHYYRLRDLEDYRIAVLKDKQIPSVSHTGYTLSPCRSLEDFRSVISEDSLISSAPSKDYKYIKWRYFDHPVFRYELWKIVNPEGEADGILVTREEYANDMTSCKIVDFYGNALSLGEIGEALDDMMRERNYEFIDVYSYGIPVSTYEKSGMLRCSKKSENIIPNFFQPYTPVNSDIMLIPPAIPNARLFRGDSDQDKPRF